MKTFKDTLLTDRVAYQQAYSINENKNKKLNDLSKVTPPVSKTQFQITACKAILANYFTASWSFFSEGPHRRGLYKQSQKY